MTDNTPTDNPKTVRLNKYVALCLGVSRRQADLLIEQGKIFINKQQASLGSRVNVDDNVTYNNQTLVPKANTYILLHKPTGYVCSRRRQGDTPTIYELLPTELHHLKPVGRLDKDSSGIILLTNDGDTAHSMTHPSFKKQKRYLVTLDQPLVPLHRQMISDFGLDLPDGKSQLTLSRQHDNDDKKWVIEMSEGRNRQIRRTFDSLGYAVTKLHRTNFGNYSLGDMTRGKYELIDIS